MSQPGAFAKWARSLKGRIFAAVVNAVFGASFLIIFLVHGGAFQLVLACLFFLSAAVSLFETVRMYRAQRASRSEAADGEP